MNTISNMLCGGSNIAPMPFISNLTNCQPINTPLYNMPTPQVSTQNILPIGNIGTNASNGNFIQNFVSQMMNLASTFMQNMFALVGLGVQGGATSPIGGLPGIVPNGNIGAAQESSKGGFLNTLGNIFGSLFGSNKASGSSDSGFSLSNIWSSIKNIFSGLFGGSNNSTNGTSDSSSGSFFSNIWSGVKNIFGGLFGGSSSSSSSGSGFSWGNILGTACSFIKDLF